MPTTTQFQDWLDNLDETHTEEMYNLQQSIIHETQMGSFTCSKNNGRLFVKYLPTNETLMLSTSKAKNAFLTKLDKDYAGLFGWLEGDYYFVHAMSKND